MNSKIIKICLLCVLSLATTALASPQAFPPSMTAGVAHSHSVSLPLNQMTVCPNAATPVSPNPHNFEGMSMTEITGGNCSLSGGFNPTDDSGAIGRHHYVQVVNTALSVYDKRGNRLAGPVSTTTFWSNQPDCGGNQIWTDSVVIHDRRANRWIISRPGGLPNGADLCLAVSQTSDPLGKYDQYAFEVNNTTNLLAGFFNDYPKISTWTHSYLATANPNKIFSGLGNTITAFDREALLAGQPAPGFVTFFIPAPAPATGVAHSHMLPADLDGKKSPPKGSPAYIVQVQDDNLGFPADRLQVYELKVDWNNPSAATLTPTASLAPDGFNSNACPSQSCIKQPQGPALDSLSYGYMMFRLSYRAFEHHETLLFNHTVAADGNPFHRHAGIRWYELRKTRTTPWSIYQQGTYAPDSDNRWLGSIAMDKHGDIALGFDVSGPSTYPSIHWAGRDRHDPPGTLPRGEFAIENGNGAQLGGIFFGDYSEMTVDPDDDCKFWFTDTYYPAPTTPDSWHTRIASFKFPECDD